MLESNLGKILKPLTPKGLFSLDSDHKFEEYIEFLRDNIVTLADYKEQTGILDARLRQVSQDLFHEDPFIVFSASLEATNILSDKSIYH